MELFPGKRLFIDDSAIEEMSGVKRVLNPPVKHPNNPFVVKKDKPWEKGGILWPQVFYDEEKKRFMVLYVAFDGEGKFMCYAESRDGLNWEKPNLELVEYKGSKENNMIPATFDNPGTIFWDPHETDPAKRYKTSAGYYSSDGIDWKPLPKSSKPPRGGFGAPKSTWGGTVNPDAKYVWYSQRGSPRRTRVIGRRDSDDYVDWGGMRTVIDTDLHDPPSTEFYSMATDPANRTYAGLHIGMLWVYHTSVAEEHDGPSWKFWGSTTIGSARMDGFIETQLAVSKDTVSWQRWRKPLIPRGKPSSWDWGMVFTDYPIIHKDKMYFYYNASEITHGGYTSEMSRSPLENKENENIRSWCQGQRPLGVATLRLDGFVSVEPAGYGDGTLTTNRFRWEKGCNLYVNTDASHGELQVELLEDTGRTVPGFTADDCDPIREDVLDKKVTWKGIDAFPVPDYARMPNLKQGDWYAKLRFHLRPGTKLYSFRLDPPDVLEWDPAKSL